MSDLVRLPPARNSQGEFVEGARVLSVERELLGEDAIGYADPDGTVPLTPGDFPLVSGPEGAFDAWFKQGRNITAFHAEDDALNNPVAWEAVGGDSAAHAEDIWVNLKEFGAKIDGETDDVNAVLFAISWAEALPAETDAVTVYCPPGQIPHSAEFGTLPERMRFVGAGRYVTQFVATDADVATAFVCSEKAEIRDMTFKRDPGVAQNPALDRWLFHLPEGASDVLIERIATSGYGGLVRLGEDGPTFRPTIRDIKGNWDGNCELPVIYEGGSADGCCRGVRVQNVHVNGIGTKLEIDSAYVLVETGADELSTVDGGWYRDCSFQYVATGAGGTTLTGYRFGLLERSLTAQMTNRWYDRCVFDHTTFAGICSLSAGPRHKRNGAYSNCRISSDFSTGGAVGVLIAHNSEAPMYGMSIDSCIVNWVRRAVVITSGDAIQELTVSATGGDYVLPSPFNPAHVTGDIPFNASADDIQTELEALPSIGAGGVLVLGGPVSDGLPKFYWVIFCGAHANTVVDDFEPDDTGLTGGTATAETILPGYADKTIQGLRVGGCDLNHTQLATEPAQRAAITLGADNVVIDPNTHTRNTLSALSRIDHAVETVDDLGAFAIGPQFCTPTSLKQVIKHFPYAANDDRRHVAGQPGETSGTHFGAPIGSAVSSQTMTANDLRLTVGEYVANVRVFDGVKVRIGTGGAPTPCHARVCLWDLDGNMIGLPTTVDIAATAANTVLFIPFAGPAVFGPGHPIIGIASDVALPLQMAISLRPARIDASQYGSEDDPLTVPTATPNSQIPMMVLAPAP